MLNTCYVLYYYLKYGSSLSLKSETKIKQWQKKHIKKHLHTICKTIPYYHNYLNRELEEFPIMDKQSFMNHFQQLNSQHISEEEAIAFAIEAEKNREFSQKLKHISVGLSSGTSGRRGAFLVSDLEGYKWAGYVLRHFLPKNILHSCDIAFFMRANSNLYEAVGSKKIHFTFYDIYKDTLEHLPALQAQNPDVLVGQPSLLLALAAYKKNGNLQIQPTRIISVAEVLEEEDKEIIKEIFQVSLIHQAYQCTEGCLALTCRYGNLHLNEDIVHIEKQYLDETRFVPIVTDFTRTTQPIIRYRLNDILQENQEICPCGSHFTRIEKIEGREDDIFYLRALQKNDMISVFPDFIRRCILFAQHTNEYRVVQQSNYDIYIYSDATAQQKQAIINEFVDLATQKKGEIPTLKFFPYDTIKGKKMKRIERL